MSQPKLPKLFNLTLTRTITEEQVADALVAAFEGGSNYWIESVDHYPYNLQSKLCLPVVIEVDEGGSYTLDMEAIQYGLEKMARLYPKYFNDEFPIDCEDYSGDANSSDAFLQYCLFGELVYG